MPELPGSAAYDRLIAALSEHCRINRIPPPGNLLLRPKTQGIGARVLCLAPHTLDLYLAATGQSPEQAAAEILVALRGERRGERFLVLDGTIWAASIRPELPPVAGEEPAERPDLRGGRWVAYSPLSQHPEP